MRGKERGLNFYVLSIVVAAYVLVVAYLGWLGYRRTRSAADYLVGGPARVHPSA